MTPPRRLLEFLLDEQRYALPFERVERVVRAVEITPLPKAPPIVLGLINVQGKVIPVADPRQRFGLAARELRTGDRIIIARTARRTVALRVDTVPGVAECFERDVVPPQDIVPGMEHLAGVVRMEDGLLLIQDLDRFLSLDEEKALDEAMSHA